MSDRFNKGKSRLLTHEQVIQKERTMMKRLGKNLPEETVKIPKIGEWELGDPISADNDGEITTRRGISNTSRPLKPIISVNSPRKPVSRQGTLDIAVPQPLSRPKTALDAPYHLKPPKSIVETNSRPTSRVQYPPGTITTDINSIIASKHRNVPKPLPVVETRNVSDENEPTFLPLEYFDDSTYEEFSLDDLMRDPSAFSRYQEITGDFYWAHCTVLSHDPSNGLFLIEWQGSKKRKKVTRFNLRFEKENEELFQRRIEAARIACKRFENQIRFDNRVQQMPSEGLPVLSPADIDEIIKYMGIRISDRHQNTFDSLVEEVKRTFKCINNELDFKFQLQHNPLIPNRDDFLDLFSHDIVGKSNGLVEHVNYDFNQILQVINQSHLFASGNVLKGLQTIWKTFMNSVEITFLFEGFEQMMTLDDYMTKQYEKLESTAKSFKSSMQDTLEGIIGSTMNDEFSLNRNREKIKYQKMVTLATRMLHTVLLSIVENTLKKYSSLFLMYSQNDISSSPQFKVELVLNKNFRLDIVPSLETFTEQILNLLVNFENTINDLPMVNLPTIEFNPSEVSFSDCGNLIQESRNSLANLLQTLFGAHQSFLNQFRHIESTLSLDPQDFVKQFDPEGKVGLDEYRKQLSEFSRVLNVLQNDLLPTYIINMFIIKCVTFRESATNITKALIISLLSHMKEFAICDIKQLQEEFNSINNQIKIIPKTPEELEKLKFFMDNVLETTRDRSLKMQSAMQRFVFLEEYKFEISNEDCQEKYKTLQLPHKLSMLIDETDRTLQVERIRMIRELRGNQRKLESDVLEITDLLPQFTSKYQDLEMTIEAVDQVNEINSKLMNLKIQQENYNRHERIFNFEQGSCRILTKVLEEFSPLYVLWNLANDWMSAHTRWLDDPFPQVKPDIMSSSISQSSKKITKLKKELSSHPVLQEKVLYPLSDQIDKFKQHIPLVSKLRHPGIKTKHWEKISEIVGFSIIPSMDLTLQMFLDLNLGRWSTQISEIAAIAAQEYNIESSLDQMDAELQTKQFSTQEFRKTGTYILVQADDLISIIDDQLVTTQTLLTSPFIGPSKKRATDRLEFLRHCHRTLEAWVQCQRGWLYLQPIFTGTSIQQKLHREARDWNNVDKQWSSIMMLTRNHPDFSNVLHHDKLFEELTTCNELLESISQGLNAYLESKRHSFPRFFFLSNDELIAILSHTKDFSEIQKSMQKLFEYIASITVDEELLITHMNDQGLESVKFINPIDGDTIEVEDWLNPLEDEMKATIKENIRDSILTSNKKKREIWISEYPSQVVLIANQVFWTQQVTSVLKQQKLRGLKVLQSKYIEQLDGLTSLIRQPLSNSIRQTVSCLLVFEVHNRDIISSLIKDEVADVESFKWTQQLRYYWEDESIVIRSINNNYDYSYEYAGNSARLVITPLTDRCYQTLLAAFKQNLSGAPSGPAGTGKTETVRDCAKALGRPCVVYNCSEEVTPEQMSQFFSGLVTSGAWSCFDEFNRIHIEVLSVIAQQVRTIQNAIASTSETFILDQRTLKLNHNAAICITMNPGYAGRTELPDNLKALFRPCAMMVPDFVFISEILLFSGGFTIASVLSIKLVALFDLCRKQLSNAHHYDWGLRAMKAILTTAGATKRKELDANESLLLVQAIRDCTLPRLVSIDVPLFEGILVDVFPDIRSSKIIGDEFRIALVQSYNEINLQPLPFYISKCSEVFETSLVRHGIMFIGGAMGGKSSTWKVLQKAISSLNGKYPYKQVQIDHLNPKSISIPELYGLFDPITSGWSDGVLSNFIRKNSMDNSDDYKWIIVDGPVDSLWIESMNSLLDDNKVLCLSNNERISLGSNVRMMFEVDDLSQASPATVSRCGMVYFDPTCLPWMALIESWESSLPESHRQLGIFIHNFLKLYIPSIIQFIEVDAKIAISTNPLFSIQNMIRLIDCFMDILRQPEMKVSIDGEDNQLSDPLDHSLYYSPFMNNGNTTFGYIEGEQIELVFERVIVFSIVWSFGSIIEEESRSLFDKFYRQLLDTNGCKCPFPNKYSVFDFYFDFSHQNWMNWCDGITGISLNDSRPIEMKLIPTNESAAMIYIGRLLINHHIPFVFNGPESSKTLAIKSLMRDFLNERFDCKQLPLSNCSTPKQLLSGIKSLMHKRSGAYGPLTNQHLVLFIDNLNSVKPEQFGSQPALELIRQILDYGGWYNTSSIEFQRIVDTTIVSSMGTQGGGLFEISERLLRHFYFLHTPKLKKASLSSIVYQLLNSKLTRYTSSIQDLARSTTTAMIEVLEQCSKVLLPIPSKLHYIFSLRNIIKVIKGIVLVNPSDCQTDSSFIKLWYHEMCREYYDRFNTVDDRRWFANILNEQFSKHFRVTFESLCPETPPVFTVFADRSQFYKESKMKIDDLINVCKDALNEHNRNSQKQLDIVMFKEAVEHMLSLTRVLHLPRGHAMLVGVKSSGRKSISRLSLQVSSMEVFEIQITRTYSFDEWRENMKSLMKMVGSQDCQTGFLFSDSQLIGNYQLEDLSNLLISGEIPNLFDRDEIEQIKSEIVQKELLTDEDPWKLFMSRAKSNLHIILVFSPYGTAFKDSMLNFPALRNETTIDWYMPWSNNALESVGRAFLSRGSLKTNPMINSIVNVCVHIHKSVENHSIQFLSDTKRFSAVTPSRFFELLDTFDTRVIEQEQSSTQLLRKYTNGVEKIRTTRSQIEELSKQLDRDIPMLEKKKAEVAAMLSDLTIKQNEVEQTRESVKQQSDIAEKEAYEAEKINRIAQDKLAEAQPILRAAQEAVDSMDKDSLVNIKQLKKIHPALRETFEAICIIFGRQPRKVESGVPGVKEDDYWPETLQLLNDVKFIQKVKTFEVEKIAKEIILKLKKYVGANKKERDEKLAAVQSGYQAVGNLYLWVCASYDYWFVYQEILPKKLEAEAAAQKFAASQAVLAQKRAHLKAVEDQLYLLQQHVEQERQNEQNLAESVAKTQLRLDRAQKIINGLSGETNRWNECADNLREGSGFILGDSLLVSASLTYLGVFSPSYRSKLLDQWKNYLSVEGILFKKSFCISNSIGNEAIIRDWVAKGLPNDTHSVENALVINSHKSSFPLLIDPQYNGTKWLRSAMGDSLIILKFDQADFLQRVKGCVSFGVPILIEIVGLKMDPLIEPILSREYSTIEGQKRITIGGETIPYSDNFRMFLSTKYPNPHYSPEICSQVTLINFTTTQEGLSDLLMNNLIEVERQDLDHKRVLLMEANAENTRQLKNIEEEILQIVSNAGSDILNDNNAIDTLTNVQKTSASIAQQIAASESTEKQINIFRTKFINVANRASLLYFCISDFAVIDPMYQFSLKWFVNIFKSAISKADHPSDSQQIIESFNRSIAQTFYQSVNFSLFSRHKLLFSSLLASRILQSEGLISQSEFSFLLQPSLSNERSPFSWLPDEVYQQLAELQKISVSFSNIIKSLSENENEWKRYYMSNEAEKEKIPQFPTLQPFQKLLLLRVFHLHRVREGLRLFISETLGKDFISPPPLNLSNVFKESSPLSPLIFIITPGIDPQDEIISVAASMELERYLKSYSLGRGRGAGAEELIIDSAERGFWVLLQNCHLSLSWMPKLESILDNLDPSKVHKRFRLCLVTMSSPGFPIGVLYQGTKLVYEIPKGIRENMLRIYGGINADEYNDIPLIEKQLLFHLSFFHSVVLERLQFGSIGWNIPYEFNPSDFSISKKHLRMFLLESQHTDIPFEALSYVIGELNYGGRVTDKWDRRALMSLLQRLFSEEVTHGGFSFGSHYQSPDFSSTHKEIEDVVTKWPIMTVGEDVGLGINATTITSRNDAIAIFNSFIEIQPTLIAAGGSLSEEQFAINMVESLMSQIPTDFNIHTFIKKFDLTDTINTVLHHEIILYNCLLVTIRDSLTNLHSGLKGFIIMDHEMEILNRSILSNKVPEQWLNHSYPSILSLKKYIVDLNSRIEFLSHWVKYGRPFVFKLSAFYHPEEFLTAVLQVYARKHHVAFDSLNWITKLLPTMDSSRITEEPDDGVYIDCLTIEGAKWDIVDKALVECSQTEILTKLPPMHLLPTQQSSSNESLYECPLYRTQNRGSGAMGLPNYIMTLGIQTKNVSPDHWIQRSVAAFITAEN